MKRLLVVVDMQNDFIDGALGTKEACGIVEPAKRYIEKAIGDDVTVVFTRDTHHENYMETQEGKKLPVPHCIEGSKGWNICDALIPFSVGRIILDKPGFGSTALMDYVTGQAFDEITLLGLCTDICVISNAMLVKAALPEAVIKVVKDCSAGVTPESHENALRAMEMCQIEII
ncbi:MAG: cysteine hydrolase [Clostridium sp.]|nr:cysteine hydrolase [Clostridium sp.]MCM1400044.1 cysteine hydrolase [Clostridium sp.]MCM1459816.1 cysteine hydrolase [Bacteroides sp.]